MPIESIEEQKVGKKKRGKRKPSDEDTPIDVEGDEDGEQEAGEQLQLLDVSHPAASKLQTIARRYRKIVRERQALTAEEKDQKSKIREILQELVGQGMLTADADGVIVFKVGKMRISCTPRDEVIRVNENGDAAE